MALRSLFFHSAFCFGLWSSVVSAIEPPESPLSAAAGALQNPASRMCLDVKKAGKSDGTAVQAYQCNGGDAQLWRLEPNANGGAQLVNPSSGKCLDVPGGKFYDGAHLQIWTCNGYPDQQWQLQSSTIVNVFSQMCVEIPSTQGYVQIAMCVNDRWNRQWDFQVWNPAAMFGNVQSVLTGQCLDLPGGDTTNGNKLWVWPCNGQQAQKWRFFDNQIVYLGDVTKCVDLPFGDTTDAKQLWLQDCNGSDNQKWGYDANTKNIHYLKNPTKCIDLFGSKTPTQQAWSIVVIFDCANWKVNQRWYAQPPEGETFLTIQLNKAIASGKNGPYTGGKGILVRNPFDDFENTEKFHYNVVPATFWTNDMYAPTAVFPTGTGFPNGNGNPDCPNDQTNGHYHLNKCPTDPHTQESSPWNYATTAYVISDTLQQFFDDFDNIQEGDWGKGVFYPTDSNSVDSRCEWLPEYNSYDCPGGTIVDGKFTPDPSRRGAGGYEPGKAGGGGAGCHFSGNQIDQTNAVVNNVNLTRSPSCECQYDFKGNWDRWVDQWIRYGYNKKEDDSWFGKGKAPGHGLDQVSCWVNNPRDMINLQNSIYWKRWEWSNQMAPKSAWDGNNPASLRVYWGWNEVPIKRSLAANRKHWSAVMIKIPAALCPGAIQNPGGSDTVACLGYGQQVNLEVDLDKWVSIGGLVPGENNAAIRPGSAVVFVREWAISCWDGKDCNWQRYFYCENWMSPNYKWQVKFNNGACYLDTGGLSNMVKSRSKNAAIIV